MTELFLCEEKETARVEAYSSLIGDLRSERDSWGYRSASALIAEAFEKHGIDFSEYRKSPEGRPYIASGQADISISHSGRYTCLLFSSCADISAGVDIEDKQLAKKRDLTGIARRFFTEEEARQVEGADDRISAFLRLWTMKEALMKARRVPLHETLQISSDHPFFIETAEYVICCESAYRD